jgi:hypothetical protein
LTIYGTVGLISGVSYKVTGKSTSGEKSILIEITQKFKDENPERLDLLV